MKNISQVILLSTSCLIWYGADNVCASVNVFSGIPKSGTHNTLHTTPYLAYPHLPSAHPRGVAESSPCLVPSAESAMLTSCLQEESNRHIRVASVCFITDTGACSGEKFSNDETPGNGNGNPGTVPDYVSDEDICVAAGYNVTNCSAGMHGEGICPANSRYFQKCVCDTNITETCNKPYYGVGTSCNGKYASCKRDDDKACKEDGYTETSCASGYAVESTCSYNSKYKKCKKSSCDGYYDCGGTWQYCTGTICASDSSKCSVSCAGDYFPYSCSSFAACSAAGGIYRNGYCSKSCGSSGNSSGDSSSSDNDNSGSSVSECENPGCHANAYCSSYGSCHCNDGYRGNGTTYCDPDPCYGVTCSDPNASCNSYWGGICSCNTGYGMSSSGLCKAHYTSEWVCCDAGFDSDTYSACMSAGHYGDASAFVSECEAQGGFRSSTISSYWVTSSYKVCSYQCYFPDSRDAYP